MDTLLILVTLALLATTIFWAWQAHYWRRKATAGEHASLNMAIEAGRIAQDSFDAGVRHALKQATGAMYLAALRVDASEPILVALRAQGRRLIGEPIEEPIVQVPESV
jgi:hypothetical protein